MYIFFNDPIPIDHLKGNSDCGSALSMGGNIHIQTKDFSSTVFNTDPTTRSKHFMYIPCCLKNGYELPDPSYFTTTKSKKALQPCSYQSILKQCH